MNNRQIGRVIALLFSGLLASVAFSSLWAVPSASVLGRIVSVSPAAVNGVDLPADATLFSGDHISTGRRGWARIFLPQGDQIYLGAHSVAQAKHVGHRLEIELIKGHLTLQTRARNRVHVHSNGLEIAPAARAVWAVARLGDGLTLVAAHQGSVTVRRLNQTLRVLPGKSVELETGSERSRSNNNPDGEDRKAGGAPPLVVSRPTRFPKVGFAYGVQVKDTLVPEVVNYHGLALGRFEVTRAQFGAFDHSYGVVSGSENMPANRISFEQAQAYCAWLSKRTGQTYRLAKEEEVKDIYEAAGENENTLDHWAGDSLTAGDAARLGETLAGSPGTAPLLQEVGHFPGRGGDELVFDLGGNVAEWVIAADGRGKLLGGSADRPADPKARLSEAAEPYRGFRVLRSHPRNTAAILVLSEQAAAAIVIPIVATRDGGKSVSPSGL